MIDERLLILIVPGTFYFGFLICALLTSNEGKKK